MKIDCFASGNEGPDIVIPKLKAAVNVELGSDIAGNFYKALHDYDSVVVCSDNKQVLERIRSQIPEKEGKRVFVTFVWDVPSLFERKRN